MADSVLSSLALLFLLHEALASVKILAPDRLKAEVTYAISTFGLVDYQAEKTIDIKLWNSLDGCEPPTDDTLSLGQNIGFLMKKGDCSFRRQAVNARRAGAYLVFTYLETGDDAHLITPTSVEETRDLELPPVVMISRKNGESLLEALQKNERVTMFIDWEIKTYTPPVKIEYLYSVVDYKSVHIYRKLLGFQIEAALANSSANGLVDLVSVPRFYRRQDFNLSSADSRKFCVDKNNVCVNPHPSVILTEPIDEVMVAGFLFCLQFDINKGNKTQNLQFFEKFLRDYENLLNLHQGKSDPVNITEHFEKSIKPEDIQRLAVGKQSFMESVVRCVDDNFDRSSGRLKPNNKLMEKLVEEGTRKKTRIPAMFIEGHLVRGDLTPATGLSALCDVIPLTGRPRECSQIELFLNNESERLQTLDPEDMELSIARRILYVVLTSGLIFVLTYLIGSYVLKKNLQSDIVRDIDASLERYYQIQNTRLEMAPRDTELTPDHS